MLSSSLDLSITTPASMTRTFNAVRVNLPNQAQYNCEEMHTFVSPYFLNLRRTFPKKNNVFRGVARTQSKLTIGVKVEQSDGTETDGVIIYNLQTAIPAAIVGTDREAEAQAVFAKWLGHTDFASFVTSLDLP